MDRIIKKLLRENLEKLCSDISISNEIIEYINKFKSSEDLLRSGGIPIEMLDRLAFGFSSEDIKTISPKKLRIKWRDDMDNVVWEVNKSGLTPKEWSKKINLNEPIDVSFENGKFYIEDGHHRYFAAKTLNKLLNVELEINSNPITKLSNLGYDDFHRCIFNQVKDKKINEHTDINFLTVYHGTKPKFVDSIKNNGLIDKTGYNQGWYMVSTDFNSALFHANPDENKKYVYVFEFKIPIEKTKYWLGYPYLWKGEKMNDNSTWFALMKKIPETFISDIKKIDYNVWIKIKNTGF